jgi:hypothetical protein
VRSAKTLRVPGTARNTDSKCSPSLLISFKSVPNTFTPTGVRMPVESMSMRVLMGIVHALT